MKILFISLLTFTLFSCQDIKKENQLKEISSMTATVYKIRKDFEAERVDTLNKIIGNVMDVEFRIRRNYKSDTINVELGKKVNAYKMIRKKLKPISGNYNKLENGTLEEIEALKKLKVDIENNAGDKAKYDEYIEFEKDKVKQLEAILGELREGQGKCLNTYKDLHQEMYDFSMSLLDKK